MTNRNFPSIYFGCGIFFCIVLFCLFSKKKHKEHLQLQLFIVYNNVEKFVHIYLVYFCLCFLLLCEDFLLEKWKKKKNWKLQIYCHFVLHYTNNEFHDQELKTVLSFVGLTRNSIRRVIPRMRLFAMNQ